MSTQTKTRIAIVNPDKCKPKKCNQECKKYCPVERVGKNCITIEKTAEISESSCIGCGICIQKCPFEAIQIINLPSELSAPVMFRYGPNRFQLHRLPLLQTGVILGLIGVNGIGKTTIMKIFANKEKPNWGLVQTPEISEIIANFRGSSLQHYFQDLYTDEIVLSCKPQMINLITVIEKTKNQKVKEMVPNREVRERYNLTHLEDRPLHVLSGGELQRVVIAKTCQKDADVYIFDEPTNYLDVKQRMFVSEEISNLKNRRHKEPPYIMVIDHDIAMLDYMSDNVCCLYGQPEAYGVTSLPMSTREGINSYLSGFIPAENIRIRPDALHFSRPTTDEEELSNETEKKYSFDYEYPNLTIVQGSFTLNVERSGWNQMDIVLLLGQNGCGKTTFVRTLAGAIKNPNVPELNISYKPQKLSASFEGTVLQLFQSKIHNSMTDAMFKSDVLNEMDMKKLYDLEVKNLSGGELQRVAITLALGKPADVYLLDEPYSMLDVEMRLSAGTAIRKYIKHMRKSAFVVEHDIAMGMYIADKVIRFSGQPGISSVAHRATVKESGMNLFMKELNITIRQDPDTLRPRINKIGSQIDREQKALGNYYMKTESHDKDAVSSKDVVSKNT